MGYFLPQLSFAERIAMPVIKLNDQQFLLRPGTNRLGGGDFVEMSVSPDVSLGVQAVIEVTGTEGVVIRPAPGREAIVLVNGVLLTDPTPLLHGDKLEVAGKELSYSDDSKVGATTFVPKAEIAAVTPEAAEAEPTPRPATSASGGRLISLVDGREYQVPATGLVIGRESGSDVVIAHKQVSRKHAVITPTLRGYELKDYSSNGVYVNGNKVNSSQLLGRADIIRIAKDEFRFSADISALAPTMSFQAFAPKAKPKASRETPSSSSRRTPSSTHALASRLGYQEKRRGTPHTPAPATTTRVVPDERGGGSGSRFNFMWAIVLILLGVAAYYMLKH